MYRGVAETGDNTILVMGKRRSVSVNVENKAAVESEWRGGEGCRAQAGAGFE